MKRYSTESSFQGIVSFRDDEASAAYAKQIEEVVHKAAEIFYKVSKDPKVASDLGVALKNLSSGSSQFESIASSDIQKEKIKGMIKDLQSSCATACSVLDSHSPGKPFDLVETEKLAPAIRSTLVNVASLVSLSEREYSRIMLQNIEHVTYNCNILMEKVNKHNWSKLSGEMDAINSELNRLISKRARLTLDEKTKAEIEAINSKISESAKGFLKSVGDYTEKGDAEEEMKAKHEDLKSLLEQLKELLQVQLKAVAVYEHKPINTELFSSSLDDLINGLETHSKPKVRDSLRIISQQMLSLEVQKKLEESAKRLKEMTLGLVRAAKTIAAEDKEEGIDEVESMADKLKADVVELSDQAASLPPPGAIGDTISQMDVLLEEIKKEEA